MSEHGAEGGFLHVRRAHLRNRRADGTLSQPYICDFVARPKGPDAVVVALYHRPAGAPESGFSGVQVLLREGLRPALSLGRADQQLAIPDAKAYTVLTEVVAGIIEREDVGREGVRKRAAIECEEEAGYQLDAEQFEFLGAGTFPSAGSMPEKFWLLAAEVKAPEIKVPALGDGSPMEEGAVSYWQGIERAIERCVLGEIEDCKTELIVRRLRDHLDHG